MLKKFVIVFISLTFILLLLQQPTIHPVYSQPTMYQNTGNPRSVIEYSEGTFSDTAIGPLPDNTTITVPAEWNSTKVYTKIYNLLHKKDWGINGTFENGNLTTEEPPAPWLYYEVGDDGSRTTGEIQSNWVTSSPINLGGAVLFKLVAGQLIESGEFAMWKENVSVDEGEVISATVKVNFYAINLTQVPPNGVKLF